MPVNKANRRFQPVLSDSLEARITPAIVVPTLPHKSLVRREFPNATQLRVYGPAQSAVSSTPVPLDELTGTYRGLKGGLYPDGANQPEGDLATWAAQATARIKPLNGKGLPDATRGRIGFLTIGQSTTRMCFEVFQQQIKTVKSAKVQLVNAAQDGVILQHWAGSNTPWAKTLGSLKQSGLTPKQVQVIWVEVALLEPRQFGDGLKHIQVNADLMADVARHARKLFPNLQIMYCSSRYYAGYTDRSTNPEPYAYESAFAIRELIRRQENHEGALEFNTSTRQPAQAPLLLWGPYYWANGRTASTVDGLTWTPADYVPDGVHPSPAGRAKVAAQLATFFKHDRFAAQWFLPPAKPPFHS